ncbi:MAG: TGS domain-containing protein, partial [Bacteroidales bacterium]|nr:TGS domain-containing protein [Bacteroidales bacterium]
MNIQITLPDGTVKSFEKGVSAMDIAKSISEGLARHVLAAKFNDEIIDALRPLEMDGSLRLLTWNDEEGKHVFWHSSAHILAAAVAELYPGVKFGIG